MKSFEELEQPLPGDDFIDKKRVKLHDIIEKNLKITEARQKEVTGLISKAAKVEDDDRRKKLLVEVKRQVALLGEEAANLNEDLLELLSNIDPLPSDLLENLKFVLDQKVGESASVEVVKLLLEGAAGVISLGMSDERRLKIREEFINDKILVNASKSMVANGILSKPKIVQVSLLVGLHAFKSWSDYITSLPNVYNHTIPSFMYKCLTYFGFKVFSKPKAIEHKEGEDSMQQETQEQEQKQKQQ